MTPPVCTLAGRTITLTTLPLALALAGCAMEVEGEDEAELTEVEAAGSQLCVYEHANYLGKVACWGGLREGGRTTIADLFDSPVGNDQITSFKVKRGIKVRFYSDMDREGAEYRANGFFGQVADPNMGSGGRPIGNDAVSSIYIERMGRTAEAWDDGDAQVCIFENADYTGQKQCWGGVRGKAYVPALFHTAVGNDRASSIALRNDVRVRAYNAVNFSGAPVTITSSHRSITGAGLANDSLSSFVIEVE